MASGHCNHDLLNRVSIAHHAMNSISAGSVHRPGPQCERHKGFWTVAKKASNFSTALTKWDNPDHRGWTCGCLWKMVNLLSNRETAALTVGNLWSDRLRQLQLATLFHQPFVVTVRHQTEYPRQLTGESLRSSKTPFQSSNARSADG